MSYSLKVIKGPDGAYLEPVPPGMMPHIPDGTFMVSGHRASVGTSDVESISIQLLDSNGTYRTAAQGGCRIPGAGQEVTG